LRRRTILSERLRALQEGEIQPVGSGRVERVDVRVVASTNRDLLAEIRTGRFREDLYYRLAVIRVHLPPLRERGRDIDLLVEHFVRLFGTPKGVKPSIDDMQRLKAYSWPGNVRELRNVVERAVALGTGPFLDVNDVWLSTLEMHGPAPVASAAGTTAHPGCAPPVVKSSSVSSE
jgi:two-component system response regulator AtoC